MAFVDCGADTEAVKRHELPMGMPWPLMVVALAPFGIPLAVLVYLLVRYPKPYFLGVPVLCLALFVSLHVTERRYPQHTSRLATGIIGVLNFYALAAVAWYEFGGGYAAGVLAIGSVVTALLVWRDPVRLGSGEIVWWGKPRDPKDTRTTSPF